MSTPQVENRPIVSTPQVEDAQLIVPAPLTLSTTRAGEALQTSANNRASYREDPNSSLRLRASDLSAPPSSETKPQSMGSLMSGSFVYDHEATSSGEQNHTGKVKKFYAFGDKLPNGEVCSEKSAQEFLKQEFATSPHLINEFIFTESEVKGGMKPGAWIEVGKETPRFYLSKTSAGTEISLNGETIKLTEDTLVLKDESGKVIGTVVINGNETTAKEIEKNDFIRSSGTITIGDRKYQFNGSELSIKNFTSDGADLTAFIINGTPPSSTRAVPKEPIPQTAPPVEPVEVKEETPVVQTPPPPTKAETPLSDSVEYMEPPKQNPPPLIKFTPLPDLSDSVVGDYHIPNAGQRDKMLLSATAGTAEKILPEDVQARLQEKFNTESYKATTDKVRELFNETLQEINKQASKTATLSEAPDSLRAELGLAPGVKVMLSHSGSGMFNMMLGEKEINRMIVRAFRDNIVLRRIGEGPFAVDGDVVILQAFQDNQGGPVCLNMSHLHGSSAEREKWYVTSYDATYQYNTHTYISESINRNPNHTTSSFNEWLTTRPSWTPDSYYGKLLETVVSTREKQCQESIDLWNAELKRQEEARIKAAKQEEQFTNITGSSYTSGYQGKTIHASPDKTLSMSAQDTRTGTFEVSPAGDVRFTVTNPEDGKSKNWNLSSYEQISKMSQEDRALATHVLTTPYQGDPHKSVERILDMFPSQVYKPGSFGGLFYSPRYYRRELQEKLVSLYPADATPKQQRAFLEKLFSVLKSEGIVTKENTSSILSALNN